ncbi:MAG: dienelactone hydrolase family protein [Methylocystis sp.]|nr:dienelactone hydrolase family protein [Methylocystis sp.]
MAADRGMTGRFADETRSSGAATISTDETGLEAGLVTLKSGVPVYAACPERGVDLPIILVAQEIFGLHEHIRDVVRRFAKLGYFALAPDFFYRYGDATRAPDIDRARAIATSVPDAETMHIFDETLAAAGRRGGDIERAAITGFCWGGRIAWLYAAYNPFIRACVPWYGRLDGPRTAELPQWPIDIAGALKVPTLGLYGGADPTIPRNLIETMNARLKAANAPAEIFVYDDAPHAFFADYRESYRERDARDAFGRAIAFLRAQGVG